jgi:phosphopantothenoylcysteine decarboxylase/phosphopantothenate--cysteine ligase
MKKVVLGVTGCIGAYKAAEIVRGLRKDGFAVQVIMTGSAQEFITPLTLETLSEEPVITDLFGEKREEGTRHISLTEECDLLLVAPATANSLAKMALGIADDFLSTFFLANRAPVMIAPAMNTQMLSHPAVQTNLGILQQRGVELIEPGEGWLACGWTGKGRLAEPEIIVSRVKERLQDASSLLGRTFLISAGPTAEPIDPVRVFTNRSSGKMGFRLAEAARDRGARVILVSGPSAEVDPPRVEVTRVMTAAEMRDAVLDRLQDAGVIIMAAAVADYRPEVVKTSKIKKGEGTFEIKLTRTDDILLEIGRRRRPDQTVVGFAAESEELEERARKKLEGKNLDLVVGNLVGKEGTGLGADANEVLLISRDGEAEAVPVMSKRKVAEKILDRIEVLLGRD